MGNDTNLLVFACMNNIKNKIYERSEYKLYGVAIPNFVIGAYYSKGWKFIKNRDLNIDEKLNEVIFWFLTNCEIEIKNSESKIYRNILIRKLHTYEKCHGDNCFGLSALQRIIVNIRMDLKQKYLLEGAEVDFQKWWVSYGADEYDLPRFELISNYKFNYLSNAYIRELYVDIYCKGKYYYQIDENIKRKFKVEISNNWHKFAIK